MRKLFTLTLALLASFSLWAESTTASWNFEENATGVTITDAGSASTARALYSSVGSSIANAAGSYCIYANLGGTKGSSTTITTSDNYANIEQISMLLGTSDRGKTEFALQVSSKADFSSDVTNVQARVTIKDNISVTTNNSMETVTYNIDPAISGYVRIILAQASGSNNKKLYVDNLSIKYSGAITDPVTDVTIAGPTKGPKDYAATFSATTDVKADSYQWFVNNVEQPGATAKTFNFTPTAVGDYSIVCKARNANNAEGAWIASDVIAFKALNTLFGELIKATLTSGSAATVTGIVGGTADVSLSSNQKMDKGKYFGITLASGKFHEGDTVVIKMTAAGQNYPCLFEDKERTNCLYLATEASSALEYKIVLPAAANSINTLYLSRESSDDGATYKWNPTLTSMSVIRPMPIKSTVEDLSAVTIDGNPFDPAALSSLKTNHSFNVEGSYVNAPKVKFSKEITITYEDYSEKVMNDSIVVTATENAGGKWEAQATINEVEYTITMGKATSHVVTYMFGTTELGTENVEVGGNPANYATYQTLHDGNLSTFNGWYSNADLTPEHAVTIAEEVINDDATYYAKFTYKYAESINIEQKVLDNGTGYDLMGYMGTINYASNIENSLDTLNDLEDKTNRNYAYLGLKVKSAGKLLNFRLANGSVLKVKFGNVGATPLVSINGGDYAEMELNSGVYTHTATSDELISIKTASSATLIFKQIMINKEIENVDLPAPGAYAITLAKTTNGSITASWEGKTDKKVNVPVGATVTLTLTPDDGYKVASVTVNGGDPLTVSENTATFTMPAAAANVVATFSVATAIDNTADEIKAVKFFENGQLFIRRGEKVYTITGEEVK